MYNGELKEKFIASYTEKISVGTFCRRLFEFTTPYEEKWGADLCTRGSKDIEIKYAIISLLADYNLA